jgi:hypothetical protein
MLDEGDGGYTGATVMARHLRKDSNNNKQGVENAWQ